MGGPHGYQLYTAGIKSADIIYATSLSNISLRIIVNVKYAEIVFTNIKFNIDLLIFLYFKGSF